MAYEPLQVNYEEWQEWQIFSVVTVSEAALLLSGGDPAQAKNRGRLDGRAYALQQALLRDIRAGKLVASTPLEYVSDKYISRCRPQSPELAGDTEVSVSALIEWADARHMSHGWNPALHDEVPQAQSHDVSRYPDELPDATGTARRANDRPLGERERTNLLRIIRALDVMARLPERGAATNVQAQIQALGFNGPGDDTVRDVLKAARALEAD